MKINSETFSTLNVKGGLFMKILYNFLSVFSIVITIALPLFAQDIKKVAFELESYGAEPKSFTPLTGKWNIDRDGSKLIYAVDGRKQKKDFSLSVYKHIDNFQNGLISVEFKGISGKIDQAAGIAFNIKPDGDYLVIRANCLENNLVLWKMIKGKRLSAAWAENVPTASNTWHTLKVIINGTKIEGWLNGKKYIDHPHNEPIGGKIGIWSKADSYVFFDNFTIQQL